MNLQQAAGAHVLLLPTVLVQFDAARAASGEFLHYEFGVVGGEIRESFLRSKVEKYFPII